MTIEREMESVKRRSRTKGGTGSIITPMMPTMAMTTTMSERFPKKAAPVMPHPSTCKYRQ